MTLLPTASDIPINHHTACARTLQVPAPLPRHQEKGYRRQGLIPPPTSADAVPAEHTEFTQTGTGRHRQAQTGTDRHRQAQTFLRYSGSGLLAPEKRETERERDYCTERGRLLLHGERETTGTRARSMLRNTTNTSY